MTTNLLAEHRKKAGLTQKQVGDRIGISPQAVSKWENGQSEPDIQALCMLAELYGVSVDILIGKTPESSHTPVAPTEEPTAKKSKKSLILILSIAIGVILIAAVVSIILFSNNTPGTKDPATLLEKFNQIELGMTMDEVKAILGDAEETLSKYVSSSNQFQEALVLVDHGYCNADFWFYHSTSYYENEDAFNDALTEDPDLDYEMKPYTTVRITFKENVVIEAFYNADIPYNFYANDYECREDKTLASVTHYGEIVTYDENKVKFTFTDGSVYLGICTVTKDHYSGSYTASHTELGEHPWGEIEYTNDQIEIIPAE